MVTGLQGVDDACQFFSHPIGDGAPARHHGPDGGTNFVELGKAIKFWGDCTGWV